ncbi:MAG TPA: Uma2 family endonuclease [Blastocatellia bacterium]|nr:Uma2 family endonuclease [Blastocatellia bacterium]HMV82578.1 Uma2 family endonuclease [Blastocatellia bacterium]HMX26183.1 Uma2 family endonuclease [Blastocatellia bacterium]HMY73683.1 Uma2 family endonuclease [Blastocatellia bacterium]HMZ22786.1 Uma2 family endonuclease [Blastocatellia bacterium]
MGTTVSKTLKTVVMGPTPHRWTRDEYYKIGELGFFDGKRVELIEGEVLEMSPVYSPHVTSVVVTADIFRLAFGKGWVIREEKPISLGASSDPEPDIAVVAGKARDYKDAHPTTAALVVEVSDSSLAYDRNEKAGLYAKSGIKDYWIINLPDRQVEVYRRPIADNAAEFGFSYANKMIFKEGKSVAPLAKPKTKIAVAELLP